MLSRIFNFKLVDGTDLGAFARLDWRECQVLAAFVSLLTGIFVACWWSTAHLFPQDPSTSRALAQVSDQIDVVFFGTSQVMFGIKPEAYAVRVLSMGAPVINARFIESVWDAHADVMTGVSTVVLEFDLGTLYLDTGRNNPFVGIALGAALLPGFDDFWRDFDGSVRWLLSPFYENRLTPRSWHLSSALRGAKRGPGKQVRLDPAVNAAAKSAYMRKLIADADSQVVAQNRAAVISLYRKLAKRGVDLRLLRLPLEPTARAQASEARVIVERQLAIAHAEGLPSNVNLIDMSDDDAFVAGDFFDANHLNDVGAARLAPRLTRAASLTSARQKNRETSSSH